MEASELARLELARTKNVPKVFVIHRLNEGSPVDFKQDENSPATPKRKFSDPPEKA